MPRSQTPVVFWDFDGTLGGRRSGHWGACVMALLERDDPGHGVSQESLAPHLRRGLPWHNHHLGHEELTDAVTWWQHITGVLLAALTATGYPSGKGAQVLTGFRELYLDPTGWEALPGALEALHVMRDAGWRNIIISNHVPELADVVAAVGLAGPTDGLVSSATIGFEKPHRKIFEAALALAGSPSTAWMIGDNPVADIAGAARLGIPGVLVDAPDHTPARLERIDVAYAGTEWADWREQLRHHAPSALEAARFVIEASTLQHAAVMSPRP